MYTSYIGLKFLEIYNRKKGSNYSAASFFDEVMFPLFFADAKHLMHVANSPFFQTPSDKDLKLSGLSKSVYQYQNLKRKISLVADTQTEKADASIYVGFAANGPDQTTAGQVSSLHWQIDSDELYASWIGNALATRVEGSQCLLIDSEPVLWHLFEGWKLYRKYIDPISGMEGRQIETWNGNWLAKGYSNKAFNPAMKGSKLDTYPWMEVVARLLEWHSGEVLPVYIFSLGQTNTTYGFINLNLPQVKHLRDARFAVKKSLLAGEADEALFWEKYKPQLSLRDVISRLGEVGLRGLYPVDYGKLMEENLTPLKINDKNRNTFLNIQTWIIAMLNNKSDLKNLAAELAAELVSYEDTGTAKDRGKTSDNTEVKTLFEAKGLVSFLNALTDFLEKRKAAAPICRSIANQVIRIPVEQFPLLKALIRFEYVFAKSSKI